MLLKNPEATIEEAVYASQELPVDALARLIDYLGNTQKIFKRLGPSFKWVQTTRKQTDDAQGKEITHDRFSPLATYAIHLPCCIA